MARISAEHRALQTALERIVGGDMNSVARVVIDIRAGYSPVIHVERLGDERVIDVVRALDGVEIKTIAKEGSSH